MKRVKVIGNSTDSRRFYELVEKVVQSAAANAENNHEMDADKLYVAEIAVNQGPTMKRWRAGSQGRASIILKRSSHIEVVLKER